MVTRRGLAEPDDASVVVADDFDVVGKKAGGIEQDAELGDVGVPADGSLDVPDRANDVG